MLKCWNIRIVQERIKEPWRMGLQACHQQTLYTIHTRVRVWLSDLGIPKKRTRSSFYCAKFSVLKGKGWYYRSTAITRMEYPTRYKIRLEENMVHFGITEPHLLPMHRHKGDWLHGPLAKSFNINLKYHRRETVFKSNQHLCLFPLQSDRCLTNNYFLAALWIGLSL